MNSAGRNEREEAFDWRGPAPLAREGVIALYSWAQPGWTFLWGMAGALPFLAAAALAPALLSLSPTVDMIAPAAEARAAAAGEIAFAAQDAPFYLLLINAADLFADAPGRLHLLAKAFGAFIIAYPLAYFVSSRFPVAVSAGLCAGFAAYAAAPFAGPGELGLAMLLVCAVAFVAPCVDTAPGRARFEGVLAGALLFGLWLLHPAFALAGFVFLSACPFLSGPCGLARYAATLVVFAVLAGLGEALAPGLNVTRAAATSDMLRLQGAVSAEEGGGISLGGVIFSMAIVLAVTAIFGGRTYRRAWIAAGGVALVSFAAARIAGADAAPVFILAAAIAAFSAMSPFYDGVFQRHDRASVCAGLTAAGLTLFWGAALIVHASGQFALQHHTARAAPADIRAELALVQPGGPTVATWLEEGRFSTPEARKYFALSPVDQSAMLLEASALARAMAEDWAREGAQKGVEIAILTGADIGCVIADQRACRADGPAAAARAGVVLAPRLALDPAGEAAGRAEALLYTEFRLLRQTPFWDVWVRRGTGEDGGGKGDDDNGDDDKGGGDKDGGDAADETSAVSAPAAPAVSP